MPTPSKYPQFENAIRKNIVDPSHMQVSHPTYAMITAYDPVNNVASIVTPLRGTDQYGRTYNNVPCPMTLGVQSVAPQVGMQCIITFKDGQTHTPVITSFMNKTCYANVHYPMQSTAQNVLPTYVAGM